MENLFGKIILADPKADQKSQPKLYQTVPGTKDGVGARSSRKNCHCGDKRAHVISPALGGRGRQISEGSKPVGTTKPGQGHRQIPHHHHPNTYTVRL